MVNTRRTKATNNSGDMKKLLSALSPTRKYNDGSVFPPHSDGVSIISLHHIFGQIIEPASKLIRDEYDNERVNPIFNTKYGERDKGEQKRFQRVFTNLEIKENRFLWAVREQMIHYAKTINKDYDHLHAMQLLISEKGCVRQVLHTDGVEGQDPFLSAIFTLEDNTSFYFSEKKVTVDKCTLLTFHSTTMHAGGDYLERRNVRIHGYIGKRKTKFPTDAVGAVNMYHCKHGDCQRMFNYITQLDEHQRTCTERNDHDTVLEKRMKRNQKWRGEQSKE